MDGNIKLPDMKEFEDFRKTQKNTFNECGKESKIVQRRNSITKIVWNFKESTQIIRNLLEKNRYFLNEETILGATKFNGYNLMMRK